MLGAALNLNASAVASGLLLAALFLGAEVLLARSGVLTGRAPATMPEWEPSRRDQPPDVIGAQVVWLGDSTAVGYGASSMSAGLPHRLASLLEQDGRPLVLAEGGARVRDVVTRQLPQLAGHAPAVAFVSVGANDTMHLTSKASFRRDYHTILAQFPPGTRVVLLGVPDMGALPRIPQPLRALAGRRCRSLDRVVRSLAAAQPGTRRHVDVGSLVGPVVRRDPARYLAADGYHPSDAGYELCAQAVIAALRPPG